MWSQWALGSITMNKASGGDGIPVELFLILKDDFVKVLHSICQEIWKIQQWQQAWKRSVFIPIPKKSNAKEGSSYCTIALISHTSKEMLKILQQYMNHDVQAGFKKGRGTRSNCQYLLDHWKTKGVPEKHLLWLSDFTFTFHFHALKKETATHSYVLAWRIPGTGEPHGLPSMRSHRVGHEWSDWAAAAWQFYF